MDERTEKLNTKSRVRRLQRVLFVLVFLVVLLLTCLTPLLADDYTYSFSFADGSRLSGIGDIVPSLAAHRSVMNGRVFSHGFVMLFLLLPKMVFNILNGGNAVLLLVLLSMFFCQSDRGITFALELCAVFILWLVTPAFGQVFLWLDGSLNYSWAVTFVLLFLYPFFCLWMKRPCMSYRSRLVRILFILFAFVAGGYSENTSCAGIFMAAAFLLFSFLRKERLPRHLVAAFLAACLGFLFMMLAPAESGRAAEHSILGIARNIQGVLIVMQRDLLPLCCGFAALITLALFLRCERRTILAALILFCGGLVSVGVFVLAVYFPQRSLCQATVFMTLSCLMLLGELSNGNFRVAVPVLAAVLGTVFVFSFVLGLGDIAVMHAEAGQREEALLSGAASGVREVSVRRYSANTKYAACYGLSDVQMNSDHWINEDLAAYYGIERVIGLPEAEHFGEDS